MSSSLFHSDGLFNMRPDGEGGEGAEAGSHPVDNKVLHRGVAPASELEGGCEDGVEVAAAGGERRAHHRGGDEAVDGRCVLRFFESNKTRSKTTDEGGNSLDDRAVQNGYGQVRRAHIVNCGVGATNMGLGDFETPKNLNHPKNSDSSEGLSHSAHCSLLPAHVSLDTLFKMVVRAGSCVAPFHRPPDGEEEKVETIGRQPIVVGDDYKLKAASTEVGGSDCFVEGGLHQTRVQRSNHLPGEFAKEEDK